MAAAGSIVLDNDNTAFAKNKPVNNGPAALGFRPEVRNLNFKPKPLCCSYYSTTSLDGWT